MLQTLRTITNWKIREIISNFFKLLISQCSQFFRQTKSDKNLNFHFAILPQLAQWWILRNAFAIFFSKNSVKSTFTFFIAQIDFTKYFWNQNFISLEENFVKTIYSVLQFYIPYLLLNQLISRNFFSVCETTKFLLFPHSAEFHSHDYKTKLRKINF